ncbi:MAG: hypothetical protein ABI672_16415 [Vicinamibacteria bacterium]
MKMNAAWHTKHVMPMGSTIEQRATWHLAHTKQCGCREMPPTVKAFLASLGRKAGSQGKNTIGAAMNRSAAHGRHGTQEAS